jgi:hypothetical protein
MVARLVVALALLSTLTCAGTKGERRYPRRPASCKLAIYNAPIPEAVAWDDIGVIEVGCYLDESEVTCLHRLRSEACRMGGDMVYGVPKRALRPTERAMVFRGMVAHTREAPPKQDDDKPADDKHAEAPHPADAGASPIVPLPLAAPEVMVAPRADGGTDGAI